MYLNFIRYPFIFYCYEQGLIFSVQLRWMSVGNFKHFKLKVVDNVGVITIDSPGVKVSFFQFNITDNNSQEIDAPELKIIIIIIKYI